MKARSWIDHLPALILIIVIGLIIHDRRQPSSQMPMEDYRGTNKVPPENEVTKKTTSGD